MIRYGKHVPSHAIGPILPRTFAQALKWLRRRGQVRIGFKHVLRISEDGKSAVVRAEGKDVWHSYKV